MSEKRKQRPYWKLSQTYAKINADRVSYWLTKNPSDIGIYLSVAYKTGYECCQRRMREKRRG